MKEELNKAVITEQEVVRKDQPSSGTLTEAIQGLNDLGGFTFLESAIDGIANMSPNRRPRKKIFLTEADKKQDRIALLKIIKLWIDILSSCKDASEMLDKCQAQSKAIGELLTKNQLTAVNAVSDLESSYRSLMLFFKNTEQDKVRNVTIMNASTEQITDLDNSRFIDYVGEELKQNYDRLDLRMNYSLLVLPGYLGSNKVVEKWAKIAYGNKVMLVTDFIDLEKPDDVVDMFFSSNLTGGEIHRSNAMTCCNWLIGRGAYNELGETENLHIPASCALAGKMYNTLMSQVTAGKAHGGINEVGGVVFPLKKSEISKLESMGLIPFVKEYGKVMAFSGKTLYSGDDLGLQTYSVVRVFDYIFKVLCDFLNRRAFENWNLKTEKNLRGQILNFLDSVKGPDALIEKFQIIRFEQDKKNPDHVFLDIRLLPFYPAKSFIIKMEGTKGNEGVDWNLESEQE